MIGTIGSLVQETSNRWRWLLSGSLYTIACLTTSMLLGVILGTLGHLIRGFVHGTTASSTFFLVGEWFIGLLAIAYAASDAGLLHLPRPTLMLAVPISWWRWWKPYGASLAYGAALGFGFTTRIFFGSFYVLCAWCILRGDAIYGALLMGTYGLARALVLFPVSWGLHCSGLPVTDWGNSRLFNLSRAQQLVAVALVMYGTLILVSAILAVSPSN